MPLQLLSVPLILCCFLTPVEPDGAYLSNTSSLHARPSHSELPRCHAGARRLRVSPGTPRNPRRLRVSPRALRRSQPFAATWREATAPVPVAVPLVWGGGGPS